MNLKWAWNELGNICFSVACLQIDNQLPSALFPVVLRLESAGDSTAQASNGAGNGGGGGLVQSEAAINMCLVVNRAESQRAFLFVPYLSARVLPIHLRLEDRLLGRLLALGQDLAMQGLRVAVVGTKKEACCLCGTASARAHRSSQCLVA
jgi:hypothetical protein